MLLLGAKLNYVHLSGSRAFYIDDAQKIAASLWVKAPTVSVSLAPRVSLVLFVFIARLFLVRSGI